MINNSGLEIVMEASVFPSPIRLNIIKFCVQHVFNMLLKSQEDIFYF
jgi:hypothetical protein